MTARLREAARAVLALNPDRDDCSPMGELRAAVAEAEAPRGPLTVDEIRDLLANQVAWEAVWEAAERYRGEGSILSACRAYCDERARNLMAALSAYHAEVEALCEAAEEAERTMFSSVPGVHATAVLAVRAAIARVRVQR